MKKLIAGLALAAVLAFAGFASVPLFGEEITTTAAPITTTAAVTTADGSVKTYVYSDVDDLIEQIYQDVYDQIYADVYAELSASIGQDLYEDIYAKVLGDLEDVIASGEVSVIVNAFQDQIDAVAIQADASVIGISTYSGADGVALGSAVIYRYDAVRNEYYVITNHHVIDGGDNYRAVFADGSYVIATLVGFDADIDIAVLRFNATNAPEGLEVSPLGSSADLTKGTVVLACGHPQGYDFFGTLTLGVVSGVDRDVAGDGVVLYIQHDASINSGNSGGPLYDLAGEVVGINVSKFATTEIEGMGFAIPIDLVKTVLATVDTGYVG